MKIVAASAGLVISTLSAQAVVLDVTGVGTGTPVDANNVLLAGLPIEAGSSQTVDIAGRTFGGGGGLLVTGTTGLGIQTNDTGGSPATDNNINELDRLAVIFNFDGSVTGLDLEGLLTTFSNQERASVSLVRDLDLGTQTELASFEFIDNNLSFFDGTAPAGTTVLDPGDSTVFPLGLSFEIGDALVFETSNSSLASYSLQSITVVPTPATAGMLALAGGLLAGRCRRGYAG
ncbi:MAG: hypothetical protein AAGL98_01140 [Planctomycetota bacterium]